MTTKKVFFIVKFMNNFGQLVFFSVSFSFVYFQEKKSRILKRKKSENIFFDKVFVYIFENQFWFENEKVLIQNQNKSRCLQKFSLTLSVEG